MAVVELVGSRERIDKVRHRRLVMVWSFSRRENRNDAVRVGDISH